MITEKRFLKKILSLFENREIGMIGLVGSPVFPENGVMWYGDRIEVYIRKARKDMEHIFWTSCGSV